VEVEYMAIYQAAKEAEWLAGLLEDIGITSQAPLLIHGDNQGALARAQNPVFHPSRNISAYNIIAPANWSGPIADC